MYPYSILHHWQKIKSRPGYSPAFSLMKDSFREGGWVCVLSHIELYATNRKYGYGPTEEEAILAAVQQDGYNPTKSQLMMLSLNDLDDLDFTVGSNET